MADKRKLIVTGSGNDIFIIEEVQGEPFMVKRPISLEDAVEQIGELLGAEVKYSEYYAGDLLSKYMGACAEPRG